jgi:hypothetical protein
MDTLYSAVGALAMGSPFLAILAILAYSYLFRSPRRRNQNPGKRRSRLSAPAGGIGPALLGLSLFYRPRLQHAIEAQQRQVEDVDEDDNGDPDTPMRHLHRQLRRIRRGEPIDKLVVRL